MRIILSLVLVAGLLTFLLLNEGTGIAGGFVIDAFKPEDQRFQLLVWNEKGSQHPANVIDTKTTAPDADQAQGFYYRIPSVSTIHLEKKDATPAPSGSVGWVSLPAKSVIEADVLISQYGSVRAMPTSSGSIKKSTFDLYLYENTGALKSVEVSGTALEPTAIESAGGVLTDLQAADIAAEKAENDAEKAAIAKAAEAEDVITVLTRQRDILQLQKEIADLENPVPDSGIDL
ncbi:MAG: hypothetical protein KJN61_02160 [Gammaproteobacteria bacterium]|nr:hypothetical protein [Gammaproteobacteria bacterium]MBT8075248.1 hypothetical protein [Gammaproteobacteria bacterium]